MSSEAVTIQPIPFRVLIDEAMKWARRHFKAIFPGVALPVSLLYSPFPLLQLFWMRRVNSGSDSSGPESTILAGCLGGLATVVVAFAVHAISQTAIVAAATDALEGRAVQMRRSWRFVLRPRVLGTLVLWWIALAVSFLLLVFPAIWVSLALSLLAPVMAAEGRTGFSAMRRSAELVRYNPQKRFIDNPKTKVFLLSCIAGVISWVVSALVELPLTIAQQVFIARQIAAGQHADPAGLLRRTLWFQVPSSFLSALVTAAVGIYTGFGIALLYADIRRRKEGVDLEAAIDRITQGARPPAGA